MYHHVLISPAAMTLGPSKVILKPKYRHSCMFVFQDIYADLPIICPTRELGNRRVLASWSVLVFSTEHLRFTGEISDMTEGHHDISKPV